MEDQSQTAEIRAALLRLEEKVNMVHQSVEKTRRYFLYTLIATVVVVVLPTIGLLFAIPAFLGTYSAVSDLSSLGL